MSDQKLVMTQAVEMVVHHIFLQPTLRLPVESVKVGTVN